MQNVPCALLAALLGATVRHSFLFCGDYYEVWYECGDGSPTTLTTLTLSQPSQASRVYKDGCMARVRARNSNRNWSN